MQISKKLQQLIQPNQTEKQKEFEQARELNEYQKEFEPQSYEQENKSLFKISNVSGYFFQCFSAATAAATVLYFSYDLTSNIYFSGFCTIVFLGLLEAAKRIVSSRFFKQFVKSKGKKRFSPGMIVIMLMLTGFSVFLSITGASKTIKEVLKNPTLLTANVSDLKQQIKDINKQIATAENQTNSKGKILYKSLDNIKALAIQKTKIQDRIFQIEDKTATDNQTITKDHTTATNEKAVFAASATLVFECLFLLCLWYEKKYKWSCVVDMELSDRKGLIIELDKEASPAPTLSSNFQLLQSQLQHLQEQNQYLLTAATTTDFKAIQATTKQEQRKHKTKKKKSKTTKPEPRKIGFFNSGDDNNLQADIKADTKPPKKTQLTENQKSDDFNSQVTKIINIENSKTCLHCENQYIYNHKKQLYCCEQCRKKAYKAKRKQVKSKSK